MADRSSSRDDWRCSVVSLVPSATETLLALGADVVACTRFCEQPTISHVGGTKNPDVAAIVAAGARTSSSSTRRRTAARTPRRWRRPALELLVTSVRSVDDALAADGRAGPPRPGRPAPPADRAAGAPPGRRRHRVRADLAAAVDVDQRRHVRRVGARRDRHRARDGRRRPSATRRSSSTTSPRVDPTLVLVPSEPYTFADAHVAELARAAPRRRRPAGRRRRTCSGGGSARPAPLERLRSSCSDALNCSSASTSNGARSARLTWSAPASTYSPTRSTTWSTDPLSTPGRTTSAIVPNCWRRLSSVHASPTFTAHSDLAPGRGRRRRSGGAGPRAWRRTSPATRTARSSRRRSGRRCAACAARRRRRPRSAGASWIGRGSLRARWSRTTCPRTSSPRRAAGRGGRRRPPPAGPCGCRRAGSRSRRPGTRPRPSRRRCPSPPGRRRSGRWP